MSPDQVDLLLEAARWAPSDESAAMLLRLGRRGNATHTRLTEAARGDLTTLFTISAVQGPM